TDPLRGWVYEYDVILTDLNVTNVSNNAADLEWEIYDNGTNTTLTVCWGLFDGGNSTMSWTNCFNLGTSTVGDWKHSLSGLVSGQTYHWRVVGENGNGQTWTDDQSFITT
ncbi:MAG: fibronectin type III domain-containing protein, partial [Candidatus Thermoplasmatota archaeon]|nr:fibronectin type III domain-containing protein [Candidatus Thermoplasmatota archaeon]